MHQAGPNPAMIRAVLIVLFVVVTQILRARKQSKASKPTSVAGKGSPVELLRQATRQASDPTRSPQGEMPMDGGPLQLSQQLRQPSTIEPESSWIPSMLLVALLACLFLMAYRYWAR